MSEWISVKDRLPTKGINVCVFMPTAIGWLDGVHMICWLSTIKDDLVFLSAETDKRYRISSVSHWMPLTKPPEES